MRFKLIIEYKGCKYSGWQRQKDVPSVQQAIEDAILAFSGQEVNLTAAGRTDAGVHARGQVAHVDFDAFTKPMQPFEIAKAINAHMRDEDISIVFVEPVDEDFHARFSAISKLYKYKIVQRSSPLSLDDHMAWHFKRPLNTQAMEDAAQLLIGKHDFTTFRDSQCQSQSPIKTLDKISVSEEEYDLYQGKNIIFSFESRSFLHHQVRNMVGTLVLVGEGKWDQKTLQQALEAKDRTKGGQTAPAQGLYLEKVIYS